MTKLIEFDCDAFRADVRKVVDADGIGAQWRLHNRAGVGPKSLMRLLKGERLRDLETVLSIAAACGLDLADYVKRNKANERGGIDWKLFRECVEMLCGGCRNELVRRARIDHVTAAKVLRYGYCRPNVFLRLCFDMKVEPEKFGRAWRTEWHLRRDRQNFAAELFELPTAGEINDTTLDFARSTG